MSRFRPLLILCAAVLLLGTSAIADGTPVPPAPPAGDAVFVPGIDGAISTWLVFGPLPDTARQGGDADVPPPDAVGVARRGFGPPPPERAAPALASPPPSTATAAAAR